MKSSYYIRQFQKHWHLILISVILAGVCTIIASPGIMYADSYGRVDFAYTITDCIKKFLTGQRAAIAAKSWLTVTPSFFIAISRWLTGDIVLYTLVQAYLFFLSSFLLIRRFCSPYKGLQYVLMIINPLFYGVSVYYEAGIGCVTGIVLLILFLSTVDKCVTHFDIVFGWFMIASSSFITFGYRANAFTIIPILIAFIIFATDHQIMRKICLIVAIMVGLLGTVILPRVLKIDTMSSYSTGFVWEMFTTIQNMDSEKQKEYVDYLDEIGGKGSTEEAVRLSSVSTVNSFLGCSNFDMLTLSEEGNGATAISKYFELWKKEPVACLQTKWEFIRKTLGIGAPINCWEYGYNIYDRMEVLGFHDWKPREWFVNSYLVFHRHITVLRYPWIIFAVTTLLVVWSWIRKYESRQLCLFILGIAVFYYGAFLINTQSFELRYFYPSLYLMIMIDMAIFMTWLGKKCSYEGNI